jgi:hypothetical protein
VHCIYLSIPQHFSLNLSFHSGKFRFDSALALTQDKDGNKECNSKSNQKDVSHHVLVEVLRLEAGALLRTSESLFRRLNIFVNFKIWINDTQNILWTCQLKSD